MGIAGLQDHLIDTDILIDDRRGHAPAQELLRSFREQGGICISVVSAFEILQGARDQAAMRRALTFVQSLTMYPMDAGVSNLGLELLFTHRLAAGLGMADALIAATALVNDLTLVTKNLKHFTAISGLKTYRPY